MVLGVWLQPRQLDVVHGIAGFESLGYPGVNADTLVVFGDECRQLCQQSLSARRIVALGNDELAQLHRRVQACDRERLRAQIGQIGKKAIKFIL